MRERVKRFGVPHRAKVVMLHHTDVYSGAGNPFLTLELLHLAHTTLKMADEEVATKAPESDAKQTSMVSAEDTPAQTGASMGV